MSAADTSGATADHASGSGVVGRLVSRFRSRVADPVAERVNTAVRPDDDPAALLAQVGVVECEIDRLGGVLPAEGTVLARLVTDGARQVLRSAHEDRLDIHGRVALNALLRDYLPTTLTRYVSARRAGGDAGAAAWDAQLADQLEAMRESVQQSLAAVLDDDVRGLEAQGIFLRTKFAGADL
ncbi:hypothetical protein [Isoptericola sp. NPDC057191]|uniref:hypothetical protein n=1 Tax=Isoptericola sp. NPDC057191 TaxID=3346041 RepID=UPI00363A5692